MTYGRDDLLDAWLAMRRAPSGSDEALFWQERVSALGAALGVSAGLGPRPAETAAHEMWALSQLGESTADLLADVRTPFEGYLEAPQEIIALSRQYGADISAAADQLRADLRRLLDATLAVVWGLPDVRRVTREQVLAHGVDPDQPPPGDDEDECW